MRLLYYISKNDFNRVFQAVFTVLETPYIYPLKREKTLKIFLTTILNPAKAGQVFSFCIFNCRLPFHIQAVKPKKPPLLKN